MPVLHPCLSIVKSSIIRLSCGTPAIQSPLGEQGMAMASRGSPHDGHKSRIPGDTSRYIGTYTYIRGQATRSSQISAYPRGRWPQGLQGYARIRRVRGHEGVIKKQGTWTKHRGRGWHGTVDAEKKGLGEEQQQVFWVHQQRSPQPRTDRKMVATAGSERETAGTARRVLLVRGRWKYHMLVARSCLCVKANKPSLPTHSPTQPSVAIGQISCPIGDWERPRC